VIELVPILRVADAERAYAWWKRLGFEQESVHRFFEGAPSFVSIRRENAKVFLSEHEGDARPDTLLYLTVDDLDRIAAEFGVVPGAAEWDEEVLELELIDPDGNRLRIGAPAS
jgi:catechol 2,3-dioxygenase-like lactoylglutathione lyase family enzyme